MSFSLQDPREVPPEPDYIDCPLCILHPGKAGPATAEVCPRCEGSGAIPVTKEELKAMKEDC